MTDSIYTTSRKGHSADVTFTFLQFNNGVRVCLEVWGGTKKITFSARSEDGSRSLTKEIIGYEWEVEERTTVHADNLVRWLALAKEYKLKENER